MKKIIVLIVLLAVCSSAFAAGQRETDRYVHPNTLFYLEISNPEKALQSVDTMLGELGLLSILGINSVKQELIGKIKNINPEYIDFEKPMTFSAVNLDNTKADKFIMMIPLKDKKFFDELKKSAKPSDTDVMIQAGSYMLIASDKGLVEKIPFKKPLDLKALDRKTEHDLSIYISGENLATLSSLKDPESLSSIGPGKMGGKTDPSASMIIKGILNVIKQLKSLSMYIDIDGTKLITSSVTEFLPGSKAAKYFGRFAANANIREYPDMLPSGYIGSFAMQVDSHSQTELTEMLFNLLDGSIMPVDVKQEFLSYSAQASELMSGPFSMAYNFDYSRLMMMAMSGENPTGPNQPDVLKLMDLQVYSVVPSSNPQKLRKVYAELYNSDSYKTYLTSMTGSEYSLKMNYIENKNVKGIKIDLIDFTMRPSRKNRKKDDFSQMNALPSLDMQIYIASDSHNVYFAIGDKALDDVAATIKNNGKPGSAFGSIQAVKDAVAEIPTDAAMLSTISPITLIKSMISGLIGGYGMDMKIAITNPAGAVGFIRIDGEKIIADGVYDAAELKDVISVIAMFMPKGENDNPPLLQN